MSQFVLETPSGIDILDGDLSIEDITLEVMACLLNDQEPWVRLWAESQREWITQWAVMERDKDLVPVKILAREFDGTVTLIENVPDPEV